MESDPAPIIAARPGRIQFRVDDVTPAVKVLPVRSLRSALEQVLDGQVLASSYTDGAQIIEVPLTSYGKVAQLHPLITAVHYAFSDHRPLLLTPDAIWLTITQGFAQHVNLHHEELRDRLVRHTGKRQLTVARERLQSAADWTATVEGWAELIAAEVGTGLDRVLTCDFSTTTSIARTASRIVMMNAFQRYFDYRASCICGIPAVTLEGTPDDWRQIRARIEVLAEYNLEWWIARVRPICDAFIETAEGQPPRRFWQDIYKPKEAYGNDVVTGWVADLFPYLNNPASRTPTLQNSLLNHPRNAITERDGIAPERFPSGLSEATCHLQEPEGNTTARLIGGLVGVRQHVGGELSVVAGWAVGGIDPYAALLEQLAAYGKPAGPINWRGLNGWVELPKEALQLLDMYHGTTFCAGSGHSWRVRELAELDLYKVDGAGYFVSAFMDLEDGRSIATCWHSITSGRLSDGTFARYEELWIVVGSPQVDTREGYEDERPFLPVDATMVIAKSFDVFCDRLLAAKGGYYFDAPDFTPDAVFERR